MNASRRRALLLAGIYLLFSVAWILGSDWLLSLFTSAETFRTVSSVKGLLFVLVSAWVIYALALRFVDGIARDTHVLLQAQRQAHVGLFASSIAHDFNNTLMAVGGGLSMLREDVDPAHHDLLDDLEEAVERGSVLARRLTRLGAEASDEAVLSQNVHRLAQKAAQAASLHRMVRGCQVVVRAPSDEHGDVYVVRAIVVLALENAIINAAQACDGNGRIEIGVTYQSDRVVVEVHDDGPGIPIELRQKIMEPFFTTRPAGSGLGMLSIRSCVLLHDGRVDIDESPLGGACIRLVLANVDKPGVEMLQPPPD